MLIDVDKMRPYERMLLLTFKHAADNSPELTPQQKARIEDRLQQVVQIWNEARG